MKTEFIPPSDISTRVEEHEYAYTYVVLGGTFDRMHKGHIAMLRKAFEMGLIVYIGITSDDYISRSPKVLSDMIHTYARRRRNLERLLKRHGLLERTRLFELNDAFGPAITESAFEAIVVSTDTLAGGEAVNRKREAAGLPPLEIAVVELVRDEENDVCSSTKLRKKELGRMYHLCS